MAFRLAGVVASCDAAEAAHFAEAAVRRHRAVADTRVCLPPPSPSACGTRRSGDGHAWAAVEVDGVWAFADPAWAAGGAVPAEYYVHAFHEGWWLAPPAAMHSHRPHASDGDWCAALPDPELQYP